MKTVSEFRANSFFRPVAVILCGIATLTASSWISIPMFPVPVTLQTAVILLMGAICGPRLGAVIVVFWLTLAFLGAPLLADGNGSPAAFVGPTAGYLASFPLAAFLAGHASKQAGLRYHFLRFGSFMAVHALILGMGFLWLAQIVGYEAAWTGGVVPFIIGAILKSALAAALMAVVLRALKQG